MNQSINQSINLHFTKKTTPQRINGMKERQGRLFVIEIAMGVEHSFRGSLYVPAIEASAAGGWSLGFSNLVN